MIVGMESSRLRDKRGGCQYPQQRKSLLEFKHSNEKTFSRGAHLYGPARARGVEVSNVSPPVCFHGARSALGLLSGSSHLFLLSSQPHPSSSPS